MLKDTLQQERFKILLIGDSCEDEYIFGTVDRLSPEAPVPVFVEKNRRKSLGMSGNVLQNLRSILPHANIVHLSNDPSHLRKIRFIDTKSNYQLMRHDVENTLAHLNFDDLKLESYDAVVISDYDKGYLTHDFCSQLTKLNIGKIFVDSKKNDLSCFQNCTIKLNEKERKAAHSCPNSSKIITTLGERGSLYEGTLYEADSVKVHDVCGAGDVFLASLVVRWIESHSMNDAIRTATKCASHSVTKLGTYVLRRSEYEKFRI